jgi:predicted Fe-Mo cluster-binding NifX family protein
MSIHMDGTVWNRAARRMPGVQRHGYISFRRSGNSGHNRFLFLQKEVQMRLCIPTVETKGLDSVLCDHFGSAPYFAVYDTESKQISTATNANSHHVHGSCMPVDSLKEHNADAVLCKGMGAGAINRLSAAGIKAFLVDARTVSEAIDKFDSKNVRSLDSRNACQRHECE